MNNIKNIISHVQRTLELEMKTKKSLIPFSNEAFENIVHYSHQSNRKIIVTGIGKSAIVDQIKVAPFNSTSMTVCFLHVEDAIHGDLCMIESEDTIICSSKCSNTPEIKLILHTIQAFYKKVICILSSRHSFFQQGSDYFIWADSGREERPHLYSFTCSTVFKMDMVLELADYTCEGKYFNENCITHSRPDGRFGKAFLKKEREYFFHPDGSTGTTTCLC